MAGISTYKKIIMAMDWTVIVASVLGGGFFTAIIRAIISKMDWIRFGKKDTEEVNKLKAETASQMAEIETTRTDNDVKISNAVFEWFMEAKTDLKMTNDRLDNEQKINANLRNELHDLKNSLARVELLLEAANTNYEREKEKNLSLIKKINEIENGYRKQ